MKELLKENFGERASVTYIDTEKTGIKDYPLVARVVQMGYGFPIVSVNGEPRFAGGIDFKQIINLIEETIIAE